MEYDVSEIIATGTLKVLLSSEATRKGHARSHEMMASKVLTFDCMNNDII